jgi:hypothetical protein
MAKKLYTSKSLPEQDKENDSRKCQSYDQRPGAKSLRHYTPGLAQLAAGASSAHQLAPPPGKRPIGQLPFPALFRNTTHKTSLILDYI